MTTAATDATVALAIEAALQPLLKSAGGPLGVVDHWAGPPVAGAAVANDLLALLGNRGSAGALIAYDDEPGALRLETLLGDAETRGRSQWAVIVVVRGPAPVRRSQPGPNAAGADPGVYELLPLVQARLNGLFIPGLLDGSRLRFLGNRWFACERGKLYAIALRFYADLALPEVDVTDPALPALHIDAGVDLIDPVEGDVAPLVDFSVDL